MQANHAGRITRIGNNTNPGILAIRAGYMDVYNNIPFNNDMTLAPAFIAKNYERGRLLALNIKLAGLKMVAWYADTRPPKVTAQMRNAIDLVGAALPGGDYRKLI